jgi:phosphinothricin acetyltransferase
MNYYIKNSFAAYPEVEHAPGFFPVLREHVTGYPFYVVENEKEVVGFGLLKRFLPPATFKRTAELTYFILPDHIGKGLGTKLVSMLTVDAKAMGIDCLLAHISSENDISLNFHKKLGFTQCGRFRRVGRKQGRDFDAVYMQKFI